MSTRAERKTNSASGTSCPAAEGRYRLDVPGRLGWLARYLKEVDANETTLRFWQEISTARGIRVERHEKYPVDKGRQKA